MPSVGMRRSTRVFGARTLRSGRKLWTTPQEGIIKYTRDANKENVSNEILIIPVDEETNVGNCNKNMRQENKNSAAIDINPERMIEKIVPEFAVEVGSVDRMRGIVYERKRKRAELTRTGLSEDERFGKKFLRKQRKKNCKDNGRLVVYGRVKRSSVSRSRNLAIVVFDSSNNSCYWITCFLILVLSYMMKVRIGIRRLSAFVLFKPIFDAYHSRGVLFRQGSITSNNRGVCIISGSRSLIPMLYVDFSAIPFFFIHMHTSLSIRSLYSSCLAVPQLLVSNDEDEEMLDVVENTNKSSFQIELIEDQSEIISEVPCTNMVAPGNNFGRREPSLPALVSRTIGHSMNLRSSRKIKKRRTAFRQKKGRARAQNIGGALATDFLKTKHDGVQFASSDPIRALKILDKRGPTLKSNVGVLKQVISTSSCAADFLVIETDRCYREKGAVLSLQQSDSKKWVIAIMKDGINHCNLTAEKVMRPCSFNRFTHDTQWTGDNGWKLEFPNKQDWLTFKELYKQCFDRNMRTPSDSVIPVPMVQEVSNPADKSYVPYVRPDSYISVEYNELTRALMKKTAIYDMDYEDEEWLNKLNEELEEQITPEKFELIIDALEKNIHHANEYSDGQAREDNCANIGRKEVLEPIRRYWMKRRKEKHSALVKIFQLYQQPRRPQVIPKSVLRKKRSFKRTPISKGRGKQRAFLQQRIFLHAIPFEVETLEQRTNFLQKVQEAKAVQERSEGLAVVKRERAQMLMENADLATYKAAVAIRIAEAAAQVSKSADTVAAASIFLGN